MEPLNQKIQKLSETPYQRIAREFKTSSDYVGAIARGKRKAVRGRALEIKNRLTEIANEKTEK